MVKMQIGKKGLTSEFIESVKFAFKNSEVVRVNLLKNSKRDREETKKIAEEIVNGLGGKKGEYTHKIIGFTIAIRKWRKPRRQ